MGFAKQFSSGLWRVLTGKESFFKFILVLYLQIFRKPREKRTTSYNFLSTDLSELNVTVSNKDQDLEYRRKPIDKETDNVLLFGVNSKNERFFAKVSLNNKLHSSCCFFLRLANGKTYQHSSNKLYSAYRSTKECFVAGGLRIRCLIPMRKWKVTFNGNLQETDLDGNSCEVYSKMNFIFTASSKPYDLKTDISTSFWAKFLLNQKANPFTVEIDKLTYDLDDYVQPGFIIGNISVQENQEIEILLWGSKKRTLERNTKTNHNHLEIMVQTRESQIFHCGYFEFHNMNSKLHYGYTVLPTGAEEYSDDLQITSNINSSLEIKRLEIFGNHKFELNFGKPEDILSFPSLNSEHETRIAFLPLNLSDDSGQAIAIHNSRENQLFTELPKPAICLPILDGTVVKSANHLVISLNENECQDSNLTGGKGSSLGCLKYLKSQIKPEYFVPNGIVVTTVAYDIFVKSGNIKKLVNKIEEIAWKENPNNIDLEGICIKTVSETSRLNLPKVIAKEVENKLYAMFGNDIANAKFAVRSSATGEDSEDMSAAGQMTTFLGISGINNILECIVKCWASQFSFTAIQYKRQNGQVLNLPMAVVVQEMISSEAAGVLFTIEPVKGNPNQITITSNYGIGESVVSATVDPDTIVLRKIKDSKPEISDYIVGRKLTMTVMSELGGIVDKEIDDIQSKKGSLSKNIAGELGQIAIQLEEIYGCPLDVEWAVIGGNIFLLQARPITTFEKETVLDLTHELDSPLKCEDEYLTKANVGEVFNGAISPLGFTIFLKNLARNFYLYMCERNKSMFFVNEFTDATLSLHGNQGFLNLPSFCLRFYRNGEKSFVTESFMIAGFGRLLDDPGLFDLADRRNHFYPIPSALKALYHIIMDLFLCKKRALNQIIAYENREIIVNKTDSVENMFTSIFQQFTAMNEPSNIHLQCTGSTTLVNCALMSVLVSEAGGWESSVFTDLSKVLASSTEVESADVPAAIEKLAQIIMQSSKRDIFCKMSYEQALEFLQTTDSEIGIQFKIFLKRHGHRCINEFDVYSKPWRINPLPVIETLLKICNQNMGFMTKKIRSVDETIEAMTTPLTLKSKLLLRLLIPLCRRAVGCREYSKTLFVRSYDYLRNALDELANKMVAEGRLPEKDLMYFLHFHELSLLLQSRSAKIIQKAIKRRAIFPKLNEDIYPEISKGLPKPVNTKCKINSPVEASFTIKGVPVSEGYAQGLARVAVNLEEAKLIKPGEILIARGTDTGWSPYFPMLAGVATELGGLVSHGAVVAREYGLPCVVGVFGATDRFKSGDTVILDGKKGLIQKIKV